MMDLFFGSLSFFSEGIGVAITLGFAALIVLLWNWRFTLVSLMVIQVSLAALGVDLYDVTERWALAQILITFLSVLILGLSMIQVDKSRSLHQPGAWPLRLLALVVVVTVWHAAGISLSLPAIAPNLVAYLTWLGVFSLLILSLSDNPLFTCAGLLIWLMLVQLVIEIVMPFPTVLTLIGMLQLLVALTGSYLALADRIPATVVRVVTTDLTFPDHVIPLDMTDRRNTVDVLALPGMRPQLSAPADPEAAKDPS